MYFPCWRRPHYEVCGSCDIFIGHTFDQLVGDFYLLLIPLVIIAYANAIEVDLLGLFLPFFSGYVLGDVSFS